MLKAFSIFYFLLLVLVVNFSFGYIDDYKFLISGIDYEGIFSSIRIRGVSACIRGEYIVPCPIIENAYPVGVLEVVRKPFETRLTGFRGMLNRIGLKLGSQYTSHTKGSYYGSNLQYAETRVYSFIPPNPLNILIASPRPWFLSLNFVSEQAGVLWKDSRYDRLIGREEGKQPCETRYRRDLRGCAGYWGSYYPRIGYIQQGNETLASAVLALRAGRIASYPAGYPSGRYRYEPRTGHYLQMLKPQRTGIYKIGIGRIEKISASRDGYYMFMHYGIFKFCPPCDIFGKFQGSRLY